MQDRKPFETITMFMYVTHCRLTDQEPDWSSLTRDEEVYWFSLAFAALEVIKTASPSMVDAALEEMKRMNTVKAGATWFDVNSDLFQRSFAAAMSKLTMPQ